LNKILGIKTSNLIENFVWSRDTIKKFNLYQDTVNLNANQFNMSVVQEQASEDEAKELMKNGFGLGLKIQRNNMWKLFGRIQ
jgi:hypothetical protein